MYTQQFSVDRIINSIRWHIPKEFTVVQKSKTNLEVIHGQMHICDIIYDEARNEILLYNGKCGFYGTLISIGLLTDIYIEGISGVSAIRLKEIVPHEDDIFTLKFESRKIYRQGKKVKPKVNLHNRYSISRGSIK